MQTLSALLGGIHAQGSFPQNMQAVDVTMRPRPCEYPSPLHSAKWQHRPCQHARASMPTPPPNISSSTCFLSMAAHCTCRANISAAFKHAPAMPNAIPQAYAGVQSKVGAQMLAACAACTRLPPSHPWPDRHGFLPARHHTHIPACAYAAHETSCFKQLDKLAAMQPTHISPARPRTGGKTHAHRCKRRQHKARSLVLTPHLAPEGQGAQMAQTRTGGGCTGGGGGSSGNMMACTACMPSAASLAATAASAATPVRLSAAAAAALAGRAASSSIARSSSSVMSPVCGAPAPVRAPRRKQPAESVILKLALLATCRFNAMLTYRIACTACEKPGGHQAPGQSSGQHWVPFAMACMVY